MKMKPISDRLFQELRRIGVSSYKVAKATGIPQPSFSKYRREGMQPTRDVLDRICAVYPSLDRLYIEFGECGGAINTTPNILEENNPDIIGMLNARIQSQQKIIDYLISENQALMRMLQVKLPNQVI